MSILNNKNDILEIQIEKENNIVKLEKDILNLTEIFNDLDIIVSNQSEFLDSIENNIIISNENIEQSSEILEKVNTNNKKKKIYFKIYRRFYSLNSNSDKSYICTNNRY